MAFLKLVHAEAGANPGPRPLIDTRLTLTEGRLEAAFAVRGAKPHIRPEWPVGRSVHGLWERDVVELFLAPRGSRLPYFEFQVSPLGQHFELLIHEPRKRVEDPGPLGTRYSARALGPDSWDGAISTDLSRLGWTGSPGDLVGGLFACLGEPGARTYWAAFLPTQEKPDFHRPDQFMALLSTSP